MATQSEEWFDVVNARDEVVGRATRREVHARGLLHRAVHVLVFLSLFFSVAITRVIREAGIVLLTRISGLLLSAIAVQLIANSVKGFINAGG